MTVTAGTVTAADLLALAGSSAVRRELVRGEVVEMSPAGFDHGAVALAIGAQLQRFARENRLGVVVAAETGFRLERDPDTVRAPDAAFVSAARLPAGRSGFLDLAPDLVVEVVSPSDRAVAGAVAEKTRAWLDAGTSLVWLVYPVPGFVSVHRPHGPVLELDRGDVLDGQDVLPGLRLPVGELFD